MHVRSAVIDSMAYVAPPTAWSSELIEQKLAPLYKRLRLPEGRLELMTGIKERRFWDHSIKPSEASAEAGRKALERSGIDPSLIEVCIHSSVSRDMLEPATASFAHRLMGLSENVQNFDVSNACLGFVNSLSLLSSMIDSGQIKAGIVVSGENGKPLLERTIELLLEGDFTRKTIKPYFANLTIGAGAVAAVVCHESLSPNGHRILGSVCMSDTSSNELCQGDSSASASGLEMQTDSEEMLHAGVALATKTWDKFKSTFAWTNETADKVICHQVGSAHQKLLFDSLGLDHEKDFSSYHNYGNTGSAALPMTLAIAAEEGFVKTGDKLALLGIGSGLNSMMMAAEW
ncbi:3-oxoacyl-ACP synthase III [Puniceicoccaceae bacterium K14]|nr:3-oxoacyl-ACP synthase III [Puniceicoccaceae bacterium K14]